MASPKKTPRDSSSFPRWLFFLAFSAMNALLSWLPFSVGIRLWLFPLVLLGELAAALGVRRWPVEAGKPLYEREFLPSWVCGPAALGLLLIASAVLRFTGLASLPAWPTWDDANYGFFGVQLAEHWHWRLFFGSEKSLPLLTWLQGLGFTLWSPSLPSLWFWPALYSFLTVPLAYAVGRTFFSKSFSFVFSLLNGLAFWPLFYGRFNTYLGSLNVLWELVVLLVLSHFLKSKGAQPTPGILLGAVLGIGLYVSVLFLPFILFILLAVWNNRPRTSSAWACLLLPLLLSGLPLYGGLAHNLLGGHVFTHSLFSGEPVSWLRQWATFGSYLTVFFFGCVDQSYWSFAAPLGGGLLNPLLGGLFFLGLAELARGSRGLARGAALAFIFILAPCLLFNTVECMRMVLLMPLVLGLCTWGLVSLISKPASCFSLAVVLAVTVVSCGLDSYNLFFGFHRWSVAEAMAPGLVIKSPERYRAFNILREIEKTQGPGFVFSDFVSDNYDQSLLVATYPFNAARNSALSSQTVRWAAVISDLHYQAPLAKEFPQSRFLDISQPDDDHRWVLALIPLSSEEERRRFQGWAGLHRSLQDLYGLMPFHVENPNFGPVLERLQALYPSAAEEPLLKAWVLEKMLDILLVSDNLTQAQWFLEKPVAATRSYPFLDMKFSVMYHRLGIALLKSGDKAGARESLKRALLFDPNYYLKKWKATAGGG